MTITTTTLTRAAGLSAAAGGLLFIGVQIGHPPVDAAFATTTEFTVRETVKIAMTVLSLVGITGMYLRFTKQTGVLGLLGYLLFGAGYLAVLSTQVVGVAVLPTLATSEPGYVNDVFAVATEGTVTGDIGLMQPFQVVGGITFLLGAFLFGIALFRADVLARWAAALLAGGAVITLTRGLVPQVNPRLFAIPLSVALIGLGVSLWREQRTAAVSSQPDVRSSELDPAGAK